MKSSEGSKHRRIFIYLAAGSKNIFLNALKFDATVLFMTLKLLGAFVASFTAGGINSVAGGGSMISFPALIALGITPLIANATNTVGIWAWCNRESFWVLKLNSIKFLRSTIGFFCRLSSEVA